MHAHSTKLLGSQSIIAAHREICKLQIIILFAESETLTD